MTKDSLTEREHPPIDQTQRVAPRGPGDPLPQYLLYRRHLFAYETARRGMRKGGVCLDIGAGLGYGLAVLASGAAKVMAFDLSDAALHSLTGIPNVEKIKGNATELPFDDASLDSVVAFQLIEHVPRAEAVRIVFEVRRVLRPGGMAFITTPNARWRLLPGKRPRNPHHMHEFTPRDMARFVREVGASESRLFGVVGNYGAHQIERARVAPSILKSYGGAPGRLAFRAWRHLRPNRGKRIYRSATTEDDEVDWFALTTTFADGLDFLLKFER